MEIKKYIEEQLAQINTNKRVDIARVEGFYDGAVATLSSIMAQIAANEKEEKGDVSKEESGKKPKSAKAE